MATAESEYCGLMGQSTRSIYSPDAHCCSSMVSSEADGSGHEGGVCCRQHMTISTNWTFCS